ncbi:hypothetical protein [Flavobacterium sp. 7A]|uniref:hypothetical protein n=1 Tax=Flavobacterium sp. 7A TaxID=2940571 RepID=UPI0022260EC3|nr:hypothetical protein [Flavobacterium sp. 7A]MCW2120410.1 hypothetical protein [Flavobacterium sp. 7A]
MIDIYKKRPFKTRNADEYNLSDILSLFVNPIEGLRSPVDFENSIIKGRMGSGKTMFLRANYAYYLFNIVPRLIEGEELILPVFIRLSDFQHIKEPNEIYRQLIIKIVEELSTIYLKLQDQKAMVNIQLGMKKIPNDIYFDSKIRQTANQLLKLGSEEYVEKLTSEFGIEGQAKYSFFSLSANYNKTTVLELKKKENPGIKDIVDIYDLLLKDSDGKVLLLIDEAGSLDRRFFKNDDNDSFFEIFMNQLRTSSFIRTKIAVYPNSYSDILTETRYGDIVQLEEDINSKESYLKFRDKVEAIIYNYLNFDFYGLDESEKILPKELFDMNETKMGDSVEQIISGSAGNLRRLIHLLDQAMNEAFISNQGTGKVTKDDAISALKNHCQSILTLFSAPEKEFIHSIAKVCKNRSTYRFKFPNNGQTLFKYLTKSQEYNILNILEAGSGRRGTTYSFDYSYCVHQDLTTHIILNTEKIDKERSYQTGDWVARNVTVDDDLIKQAEMPGKISGLVRFINEGSGFITDVDEKEYFFRKDYIVESDKNKSIYRGKELIFHPWKSGDILIATEIEII